VITTTCQWLEDRCDRPAVGDAAHPVHGVIPICHTHATGFGIPLIATTSKDH
jgi:hypothetical protein